MKLLQDNIVFLVVFFGSLFTLATVAIKLGTAWIKERSVGKTAVEEIKETMKKDRDSINKVLSVLQEHFEVIIEKLIDKTKM